jgi:hypothetical protein
MALVSGLRFHKHTSDPWSAAAERLLHSDLPLEEGRAARQLRVLAVFGDARRR